MSKKIDRRSFIKKTTAIGAASLLGGGMISGCGNKKASQVKKVSNPGIAAVRGKDYSLNTRKAIEALGGMETFVAKDAKVAILANPQRNNPGTYTKPQILQATIQMCKEAGADNIGCISQLPLQNWQATGLKKVVDDEHIDLIIIDRKDDSQFKTVPIPRGVALKEADIMKPFFDFDVFIDMPITKDHAGNKFTGTMKNLMGLSSGKTNSTFHKKGWQTEINAIDHLDQCIADLNTIIPPDLCITDATEIITTNGPFGPGKLINPRKVVAGTDRIAMDSYCCKLWGLEPEDILHIKKGHAHGLGEIDAAKIKIKELNA
ncbi:MAG: DUF362 domain-containing protein [bacterium]